MRTESLTNLNQFVSPLPIRDISASAVEDAWQEVEIVYGQLCRNKYFGILLTDTHAELGRDKAHLLLTALYAVLIAKKLCWYSQSMIGKVIAGSLLHDIGKMSHGNEHLHPVRGLELLDGWGFEVEAVKQIILQHHERADGSGYPLGLTGTRIFPLAKIVGLADDFTNHLVESNLSPSQALHDFQGHRHDPEAFTALVELVGGKHE